MKTEEKKQMSESLSIGIMLAIVGGFLDAYTYITRGKVFANAQTGNMVLFGVSLAEGKFYNAIVYLVPIVAFAIGIFISDLIRNKYRNSKHRLHWRQLVIFLELILLFGVAFIKEGDKDIVVNVIVSFVCSLQVESFRKLRGNAYATTMCTGNLRSATSNLMQYKDTKDKEKIKISLRYYAIILFFIIGASVGAILTNIFIEKSVIFCCIILLIIFICLYSETSISYKIKNKKLDK